MDGPNWNRLVEQGRAKAIGVSWSDDELRAIYQYKIPVEYVRAGCLTLDQLEKAKQDVASEVSKGKEKPLRYMRKDELLEKAKAVGLTVTEDTTRPELILLIGEANK